MSEKTNTEKAALSANGDDLKAAVEQDREDIRKEQEKKIAWGTVLHAVQFKYNPKTDYIYKRDADGHLLDGYPKLKKDAKPLITEKQVEDFVTAFSDTKDIAWTWHDRDKYTLKEEQDAQERGNFNVRAGEPKPLHVHVVVRSTQEEGKRRAQIRVSTIARGLGIPENMVSVMKGRDAFAAQLAYLVHRTLKAKRDGKYQYDWTNVSANFAWAQQAERYLIKKERQLGTDMHFGKWIEGLDPSNRNYTVELWRNAVFYDGVKLKEVAKRIPTLYSKHHKMFVEARHAYLTEQADKILPTFRINFLITGKPGRGKTELAKALARSFYPNREDDEDIFFQTGAAKVRFSGYDGEPVIIWSDVDGNELAQEFERQTFMDMIDTVPNKVRTHVKFGDVILVNTVNIFCTTQEFPKFLAELNHMQADDIDYQRKNGNLGQVYRRMPLIIPLHERDFDILINKQFMGDSDDFREYEGYRHVVGSFQVLRQVLKDNEKLVRIVGAQTIEPVRRLAEHAVSTRKDDPPPYFGEDEDPIAEVVYLTPEEEERIKPFATFGMLPSAKTKEDLEKEHNVKVANDAFEYALKICQKEVDALAIDDELPDEQLLPYTYIVPLLLAKNGEVKGYTYGINFRHMYKAMGAMPMEIYAKAAQNTDRMYCIVQYYARYGLTLAEQSPNPADPAGPTILTMPYDGILKKPSGKLKYQGQTYDPVTKKRIKGTTDIVGDNALFSNAPVDDDEPF